MEFNSGLEESSEITERALLICTKLFREYLNTETHGLFSWGSVARREMGPYSDLDLVIISKKPNIRQINKYRQALTKALPKNRLDLLEKYSLKELSQIALVDGTDRQALMFLRSELCPPQLLNMVQKKTLEFKKDKIRNLREIFHVTANLDLVYPNLFGLNNLKFSPGRLKDFYFSFLLVKVIEENDEINDIKSALKYLHKKKLISDKETQSSIQILDKLFFIRNRVQEVNKSYQSIMHYETVQQLSKIMEMDVSEINDFLQISQRKIKLIYLKLKGISANMAIGLLNKETYQLIDSIIKSPENIDPRVVDKIINCDNDIPKVLLAYFTTDPLILEELRKNNLNNWYVLYGLANNRNSTQRTLYHLMVPKNNEKKIVKSLYTDFAWRNIYLYIAKNPSANERVKKHIINYPNARLMDIRAALGLD